MADIKINGKIGGICFFTRMIKKPNINLDRTHSVNSLTHEEPKKVLIVYVHPEPRSLNGHLKDIAVKVLSEKGYKVSVSDLYSENFKPLFDRTDYPFYTETIFNPSSANMMSNELDLLPEDVKREKQRLEEADLIIFQFPVWRFTSPSMLHAYFERVLLPGWAYSTDTPALKGKKALICTSAGKMESDYVHGKSGTMKENFRHILVGTLGYVGFEVLEPFITYNIFRLSNTDRGEKIHQFEEVMRHIETRPLLEI